MAQTTILGRRRLFTTPGSKAYDELKWFKRDSVIINPMSNTPVFEQKDVEFPEGWSLNAINIVAQKYFSGTPGTPEREDGLKKLVDRVVDTVTRQGLQEGYFETDNEAEDFREELKYILATQRAAFNSPVWFNCGLYQDYGITSDKGGNWYWDFNKNSIQPAINNYERPQCSACFIQAAHDDLFDMFDLIKSEARLFKYGSGTGSNFSKIRGKGEKLSGGGESSGLLSFLKVFDAAAGSIKSGGTTRRAAKMVCLDMEHPDIIDFINWKVTEEKKVAALVAAGYNSDFNGPAYGTVTAQNSNNSVRVTDEFMEAVDNNSEWQTRYRTSKEVAATYQAADIWKQICYAAWKCADPGLQYDTTINDWHTCPNTDKIHASNPCVTGDTLVATSDGWQRIDSLVGKVAQIVGGDGSLHLVNEIFPTGTKPVYRLRTRSGFEIRITGDHKVLTVSRGDVPVNNLVIGEKLILQGAGFGIQTLSESLAFAIGVAVGDGCLSRSTSTGNLQEIITLVMDKKEQPILEKVAVGMNALKTGTRPAGMVGNPTFVQVSTKHEGVTRLSFSSQSIIEEFKKLAVLDERSDHKKFTDAIFGLDRSSLANVLRGLFTTDGTVANYGEKSQYISLDSTSSELLQQVQLLLLNFGIKGKIYRERRNGKLESSLPDGKGGTKIYQVKEIHSLRISRSSRMIFAQEIGFDPASPKTEALKELNASFEAYEDLPIDEIVEITLLREEPVFDLTERATNHFVANGLVIHNCSEYMFLDDSACNLASVNLIKFVDEEGKFNIDAYRHTCRIMFIAQEILVDFSSYPTQPIGQNSHDYRPLGLGFANLGTLLMCKGIPYDSPEACAVAGSLTAIMTGHAYRTSAEMASRKGPFNGYEKNSKPMLRVMNMHRDAAYKIDPEYCPESLLLAAQEDWDLAVEYGEKWGYRNAQATVIAPTGTIGLLMDCDCTSAEPDFALVKFKKLAGGGHFKIVNQSVPVALQNLGYTEPQIKEIITYAVGTATLKDAPFINRESLAVRGVTEEDLDRIEKQLVSTFELAHVFNQFNVSAATLKAAKLPADAFANSDFDFLSAIGFSSKEIEEANKSVCGMMTVEGAPHLKEEHLAVFDCANKCGRYGTRFIKPMGHVRIMAAIQPFISGAISKTVNLPFEATEEEISDIYFQGWKLGLKAIAMYRDGSKLSQPLNSGSTKNDEKDTEKETVSNPYQNTRRRLPDERQSITHKFSIAGHEGYITVGLFEDGTPGEIFVTMAKQGSVISGLVDSFATSISIALQYNVPLAVLVNKFSHVRFEPAGITNNPNIRIAKSIVDYIFRWMGMKFLDKDAQGEIGFNAPKTLAAESSDTITAVPVAVDALQEKPVTLTVEPASVTPPAAINQSVRLDINREATMTKVNPGKFRFDIHSDAPSCPKCSGMMTRNGSCYVCRDCGETSGCS